MTDPSAPGDGVLARADPVVDRHLDLGGPVEVVALA